MSRNIKAPGITAIMAGGLGNQLFQFAAAYTQSRRLSVPLKIDISNFMRSGSRSPIITSFALPEAVMVSSLPYASFFLRELFSKTSRGFNKHEFYEKSIDFSPSIFEVKPGTRLRGYFQSPLYFSDLNWNIDDWLRLLNLSDLEIKSVTKLSRQPFIAIHIRRGDYLSKAASSHHGIATSEYYLAGIREMKAKLGDIKVLYFSDSPEIASRELGVELSQFVPLSLSEKATLVLLSRARGLVISNSSFSWWAGWMANLNSPTPVIAPSPWLSGGDIKTLIPQSWELLPR